MRQTLSSTSPEGRWFESIIATRLASLKSMVCVLKNHFLKSSISVLLLAVHHYGMKFNYSESKIYSLRIS